MLPQVTTIDVTDISTTSATVGGEIVSNGGGNIIECGVCWSTEAEPTINDNFVMAHATTGTYTVVLDSLSSNITYTVRAYAKNEAGIGYGNVLSFITLEGGGGFNDHEYVDLGLPSGLLWATCNVGAYSPEDYGDYFAWGETQSKDTYNWSTYQYCNGGDGWNTLTKYCRDSYYGSYGYNGFTDNLTTLLPEDDAATANWGNEWRMPTKGEWRELYNNTTVTMTTQNVVNGRLFTAANGNSLFLPAAGIRSDSSLLDAGSFGFYSSSSLGGEYPCNSWTFIFYSSNYWMDECGPRCHGRSVRPVRSAQ